MPRSDDAGPSVATILVRRSRRISSCFSGLSGPVPAGLAVPAGGCTGGARDCSGFFGG